MLGDHKFVKMSDGVELHSFIREIGAPKWLIVTHGIGENLERHKYIIDILGRDFNLCIYDLRGHGRSLGEPAYVDQFKTFLSDLDSLITFLIKKYRVSKYSLLGHSMGGLITLGFVQKYKDLEILPSSVMVNAPALGFGGVGGILSDLLSFDFNKKLANIDFSVQLGGLVDLKNLSHNPMVKEKYLNDTLNAKKLHSRLLLQMSLFSKEVLSRPINVNYPLFCTVGSSDKIVNLKAITNYFTEVEKKAQFEIIEGAFHEIHNEVDRYRAKYFELMKKFFLK